MLGENDEEFVVTGAASVTDDSYRWEAVVNGASYPVDTIHLLFMLSIDTCL